MIVEIVCQRQLCETESVELEASRIENLVDVHRRPVNSVIAEHTCHS